MDYSGVTLETTSWEDAWKHVRDILPEAVYMTPGSLLAVAEKTGRSITMTHLANSPAGSNNATALRELLTFCKLDERIILITDHSFAGGFPFLFCRSTCDLFAHAYQKATGEIILSGADVVFICPESRILLLADHEGPVTVIR